MKVEIEVVTGFLGAGKSAFINSLIELTAISYERIVVLQFEDGKTKIDHNICKKHGAILIGHSSDSVEKYEDIILDIITRLKPHRIIIEHNGTLSMDILLSKLYSKEIKKHIKITCIYFIIDDKTAGFYLKNMGELLIPSIEISNLILINNYSNEIKEKEKESIKLLEVINNKAHILKCKSNGEILETLEKSKLFSKRIVRKIVLRTLEKKVSKR